jgi:hypothetical protein
VTDLATIQAGHLVWSKGTNDFGDGRRGGMVVRRDDNPDTGERFLLILTDSPANPRQDSLIRQKAKGGHERMGLVARLERMSLDDLDANAADDFRAAGRVWTYAIKALRAASVPPCDRIGSRLHDDLITAYRILRSEAELLHRGAA